MGKKKAVISRFNNGKGRHDMKQPSHGKATSRFADKPVQRNAANARERSRMRTLSKAFCKLKTTLPWVPADTKLSKLDTLRLASCYISYLKEVLEEPDGQNCDASKTPKHPMTMAWPILALASSSHKFPDRSSQAAPKSSVPGNLYSSQHTYDSVKQPSQANSTHPSPQTSWSSLSHLL